MEGRFKKRKNPRCGGVRFSQYTDTHINYSINSILWLINTLASKRPRSRQSQ